MYHIFIHSSVNGHLGCFHVLAIVYIAAMNTRVDVSFRIVVFSGNMPSSGIAGSYGTFTHNFLKKSPHYSEQWLSLFFGLQNHCRMVTAAKKLKGANSLEVEL